MTVILTNNEVLLRLGQFNNAMKLGEYSAQQR